MARTGDHRRMTLNLKCETCNKDILLLDGGVSFGKDGINHISCATKKLRGKIHD